MNAIVWQQKLNSLMYLTTNDTSGEMNLNENIG